MSNHETRPRTRRRALRTLLLAALLGFVVVDSAGADPRLENDYWAGTWTTELRFDDEAVETWEIVITPTDSGYSVRAGKHAGEILVMSKSLLHLKFADTVQTRFELKRNGDEACLGTVAQPGHEHRGEGGASGRRKHGFSGFFIIGPRTLKWGEKAEYRLMYARDGLRRPWGGEARWKIDRAGRKFALLGHKKATTRTLSAPVENETFDEVKVVLRAYSRSNEAFADKLTEARIVITVSNLHGKCAALAQQIKLVETDIAALETTRRELQGQLGALAFPDPWTSATGDKLRRDLATAKAELAAAEAGAKKLSETLARLRRIQWSLGSIQRRLQSVTTKLGRAFALLGWYKRVPSTEENQIAFVTAWTGRRPSSPRIDAEFEAAYLEAHRMGVATVGSALVQIGGLVTLIQSPDIRRGAALMAMIRSGFSLTLGVDVDKKINAVALGESLERAQGEIGAFASRLQSLNRLAERHARATTAKKRKRIEYALNRAGLKALVETIEAGQAIRASLVQLRRAQRAAGSVIHGLRSRVAHLEKQAAKSALKQAQHAAELNRARAAKARLEARLAPNAKSLEARRKELATLRKLHRAHCKQGDATDDGPSSTERTDGKFIPRRGRIVAASFFAGSTDGWTLDGDAKDLKAVGDHLEATDLGKHVLWYFKAPTKFVGDRRKSYGHLLVFELNQIRNGSPTWNHQVANLTDGTTELSYKLPKRATAHGWTRFEVCLHETHGWWNVTKKRAATREDMLRVLRNLRSLRLNCEHSSDRDVGGLRSVVLYGE